MLKFVGKRKYNKVLLLVFMFFLLTSCVIPVMAGDTWPFEGESAHGENQPSVHGYTSGHILDWSPETDPYAEMLRSFVPLQQRIEPLAATQANPNLNPDVQVFNLAGDYGNAFIENAPYTNKFAQYHFNFWQYIDYYSYWHGTATAYTPPEYYNDLAQSDWTQKWFEFGCLNIPNPTYTDAAHKNGVLSLACIFFSNNDRGQQTYKQMLVKDQNGGFPVAEKLVDMAQYFGYDGYFFNQEETGPDVAVNDIADYIAFLKVLQNAGLYVNWYDAVNSSTGSNSFARQFTGSNIDWLYDRGNNESVTDSFFFDYGVSTRLINASKNYLDQLNASEGTNYDIYDVGFAGLEAGRDRFRNSFYGKLDEKGVPAISIAMLGTDFVHAGLDEDMGLIWPVKHRAENDYQWMITVREQLWWSGPYRDPKNTDVNGAYDYSDVHVNSISWPGMASAISARSVINGSNFYTNFNTGHGLSFYIDGVVSNNEEWSNISLQDIPVSWQWWQDTSGSRLTVDFDYGPEYEMTENTKNRFNYQKIGAYNGGSSLAVNGNLNAENFLRLYKTDLDLNANSRLSVTYNKASRTDTSSMSIGLIFKENPKDVVKLPVPNSGQMTSGWISTELDLSAYADKTIAVLGLVFNNREETINNYQMNIGQLRLFDGSASHPAAPNGLAIVNMFPDTGEMIIKWNMQDYNEVQRYNIYVNDVYVGGKFDGIFYIKNLPAQSGIIKVVPVGIDGLEGDAAVLSFDLNRAVDNIAVNSQENGTLDISWINPADVEGDINIKVCSTNLKAENIVFAEKTVSSGSTSVLFTGMPINGDDYIVQITVGDNNPVSISGNFIDKICEPYAEDWSWDGTMLNLPMPNTRDWRYMYVYEDGTARWFNTTYGQGYKQMIVRGRSTKDCLGFKSAANNVFVVMEDYAGNKSDRVYLKKQSD